MICYKCAEEIRIIILRSIERVTVDEEPVWVIPCRNDPGSESFIDEFGDKLEGIEAGDARDTGMVIRAFRKHVCKKG